MNINTFGSYNDFNNYSINFNLQNNNLIIRLWEYIKSKLYSTEKCINEFENHESENQEYFSEICPDNVISIKKTLNNISNTLRNSSFEKELRIFNTIRDMHIYILDNNIASDESYSFLMRTLDLFEEIINHLRDENSSNDIEAWKLFNKKLFKFEEEFYENYYEPTHEFDDLIVDITRIILE